MTPKANASIVTYRTPVDEIDGVLSLLEKSEAISSVYVIDNSSLPEIESVVRAHSPRCIYIPSENIGYGAAHNIALRHSIASGIPYHFVLNSDIAFQPAHLEILIDKMATDPDIGLLHPRVVGPNGDDLYTARLLPTPFILLARRFFPQFEKSRINGRYLLKHIDRSRQFTAPYFQGSFMLFSTSHLGKCGLFDERFFMYPEDIDITRRMYRHARCFYTPEVTVVHNHRAESYRSLKMLIIHLGNMARYFNKWGWVFDRERILINKKTEQQ